ncbi:hypothetical protein BKA69DRAFT_592221 [Paraphysoderma sedebokerense]|nr:hypothetical protein BKA69DRAFT_592221 [Paraphysoderma sedebokerense]
MDRGKNFGFCQSSPCDSSQHNVTVQIGSQPCSSVLLYNDSYVTCTAPLGSGANQTVSVVVAGQISMDAVRYSYNPPEITSILPPFLVSANPTVFIDGANFGNSSDTRSVIFTDTSSARK